MKAAVLHEFKQPLIFKEVPRPQLEPGDVLIKVEACGVCHSDLHLADGDWSQLAAIVKRPLILGHEIAGRVIEKGGRRARFADRRSSWRTLGVLDVRRVRILPGRE